MMEKEILVCKQSAIPDSVKTIAGCVSAGDYDAMAIWICLLVEGFQKNIRCRPEVLYCKIIKVFLQMLLRRFVRLYKKPGMITSAVWTDFDNDKQTDLVIAGEWMPIRFFKNNHGQVDRK